VHAFGKAGESWNQTTELEGFANLDYAVEQEKLNSEARGAGEEAQALGSFGAASVTNRGSPWASSKARRALRSLSFTSSIRSKS